MVGQTISHIIVKSDKSIIKKRKPLRLKEYDYSLEGSYFVTICAKDRIHLFGKTIHGKMHYNGVGEIAERCWKEMTKHFSDIILDEFIVMPNHVHGIIILNEPDCRDVQLNIPTDNSRNNVPTNYYSRISPIRHSLGVIVRTYKAAVATTCRQNGNTDFQWQHGYYDHIIRNERSLYKIREYIRTNPEQWTWDKENPLFQGKNEFDRWLIEEGKHKINTRKIL